jgi:hypothetical protein
VHIVEQPHGTGRRGIFTTSKQFALRGIALALVLSVLHLSVVPTVFADEAPTSVEEQQEGTASQFGMGAASFFLTVPYGLVKVVYAALGGIVGGFTYALTAGNEKAAKSVWYTSLRGTYVITPAHLTGEKSVRFFGVPPDAGPEYASEPLPEQAIDSMSVHKPAK